MIDKKIIIEKTAEYANGLLDKIIGKDSMLIFTKPFATRFIDNKLVQLDSMLNMIATPEGKIDIEGILNETVDNLIVAKSKNINGVTVGEGSIKFYIPYVKKELTLTTDDIEELRDLIVNGAK